MKTRFLKLRNFYQNCLAIPWFSDSTWDRKAKSWGRELKAQTLRLTVKPWELEGKMTLSCNWPRLLHVNVCEMSHLLARSPRSSAEVFDWPYSGMGTNGINFGNYLFWISLHCNIYKTAWNKIFRSTVKEVCNKILGLRVAKSWITAEGHFLKDHIKAMLLAFA